MSSAELVPSSPDTICAELQEQTLQACRVARIAAGIVAEGIATGVPSLSTESASARRSSTLSIARSIRA